MVVIHTYEYDRGNVHVATKDFHICYCYVADLDDALPLHLHRSKTIDITRIFLAVSSLILPPLA